MDSLKKMYTKCQWTPTDIDFEALRHFYNSIQKEKNFDLMSVLIQSVDSLSKLLLEEWKMIQTYGDMRQIIILLQFPFLMEPNYHDTILCRLMECILQLPAAQKSMFKHMLDHVPKDVFSQLIALFQQFITLRLYGRGYIDEQIAYATRMLRMLNQVNEAKLLHKDKVHYDQFYNDAVNSIVDLEEDYKRMINSLENGQTGNGFEDFSFCQFAFILDPQSKKQILQINVASQQRKQARDILIASLLSPQIPSCFLELNIHRERLLQSALNELTEKQNDLKKPLKIHFVGEEGIDDGGLQKEFFQLIIRQIFDVQYGMFEENEQTRTFWFNSNSFEHENNFRLVGTVLGLAIYNDVIFDVRFPLVLYKKLLGMEPTLEDLKDMDPDLGNGLQALLDFQGNVEEVFCTTFQVETEAFGNIIRHDLIPNGAHIPVTEHNRQQYVELLVKWKLTDSIKKQFNAFHDGFKKVLDSQHILHLFRPEELELMICGSPNLDFDALERVTKYADGFDKNDPYIAWFWEIVKSLSQEDKKKFLCFCTGSDRVPIKGLGSMEFVVAKNGNDSDRLPTAHTCYNYLLIPRYNSKEKLRDRLLTAIQNFQGFGLR
jgi:ubiquitin-protein ligase E3 A